MTELDTLQSGQFVEMRGKRFVVLRVEDWETLIAWLEERDDLRLARAALADMAAAGGNSARVGWLKWDNVTHELE